METQGNILVPIALFGWIPLILAMFALLPPRRAVIYGFLVAWLFLPMAHYEVPGFTDYNKMSAACFGVLISALIFDSGTLFAFRPTIWDLPMLVWCVCPFFSSMTNGLGAYDGFAAIAYQTTLWGLPYLIGRIYFNDLKGMRELAIGIVIGGLIYVPLCWFEIRMSPQLHQLVYGYHQHEFGQSIRYGGYRPMVFMQHGLAVGMWMGAATMMAFWLFRSKTVERIGSIPIAAAFLILLVTSIFCKSIGALGLMMTGMVILSLTKLTRWPIWILALAILPPVYMIARGTNAWTGMDLIKEIGLRDERGASSLRIRFESERYFVDRAMQKPLYGWAGWNRFRRTEETEEVVDVPNVPDALWIIALGHQGLVGLVSLTATLVLPMFVLAWKIPVRYWAHPGAAPAAALAVLSALYMCDNLLNAMNNPIFLLGVGGICGLRFSMRNAAGRGFTIIQQPPHPAQPQLPMRPSTAA